MSQPIAPIAAGLPLDASPGLASSPAVRGASFPDLMMGGIDKANHQVLQAQSQAAAFALDDSIPIHQVTYALEQARLSVELMLQVRAKLADGLQEVLKMQL